MDISLLLIISLIITTVGLFLLQAAEWKLGAAIIGFIIAVYALLQNSTLGLFPLIPAVWAGFVIIYGLVSYIRESGAGRW